MVSECMYMLHGKDKKMKSLTEVLNYNGLVFDFRIVHVGTRHPSFDVPFFLFEISFNRCERWCNMTKSGGIAQDEGLDRE